MSAFVASLRQLTEHCNYVNNLDTMLRDRLVCGINDSRIQNRLQRQRVNLCASLGTCFVAASAAERNSTAIQDIKNAPQIDVPPGNNKVFQLKHVSERSKACHRCGARNHIPEMTFLQKANGRYNLSGRILKRTPMNELLRFGRSMPKLWEPKNHTSSRYIRGKWANAIRT